MAFSLYHVTADYVDQSGIIAGPGWICQTRREAEHIWQRCHYDRKLTNIKLELKTYGL